MLASAFLGILAVQVNRQPSTKLADILVIEDEPIQAAVLEHALRDEGYSVTCLKHGGQVLNWVKTQSPDAVLLDLVLPDADGIELCRQLRQFSNVPVIMITGRTEEVDKLRGLDSGADDYICKPVSPPELLARLRALLRRTGSQRQPSKSGLVLDSSRHVATWNEVDLDLTVAEFRILDALAGRLGVVFNRQQLLQAMDAEEDVSERTVDSHIKNLRRKLAEAGGGEPIESVYGLGYRFRAADSNTSTAPRKPTPDK